MSNPNSTHPQKDVLTTDDPATAIFTSFAKVYTMNPNNKTFWLPSSTAAVPVSFYFDKHRSVYRIISYDKKDLVVNSTIFPTMTFIKTSTTFGLWSDTKLRTIYGLGFSSNDHLEQFAEWFEKIVHAAKKLEENLPLPLPVPSTASVPGDDGSSLATIHPGPERQPQTEARPSKKHSGSTLGATASVWYDGESHSHNNNNSYEPPRTVHLVDSKIDLNRNRGDGDFEVQMKTSPMAQLALENLQYQREVLKVKQLEIELHSMRTTVNTMHETLQKKCSECERLRKDFGEATAEIEELKAKVASTQEAALKLQEAEAMLKEQIEDLRIQNDEKEQLLLERKEEVRYLKVEVEKGEEVRKENEILKERLRQLQTEFDLADKNWDVVEMASSDMTDIIQGLIGIQSRLKDVVPSSSGGEM